MMLTTVANVVAHPRSSWCNWICNLVYLWGSLPITHSHAWQGDAGIQLSAQHGLSAQHWLSAGALVPFHVVLSIVGMYELSYHTAAWFQKWIFQGKRCGRFQSLKMWTLNWKSSLPLYSIGSAVIAPTQIREEET